MTKENTGGNMDNNMSVPKMNRTLLEQLLSEKASDGEILKRTTVHTSVEYTIEKIVFQMKDVIYECLKIDGGMKEELFTDVQQLPSAEVA